MRAKEFIDEDVTYLDYERRKRAFNDRMSDYEKYDQAAAFQQRDKVPAPDFDDPMYDPEVAGDMEKMGEPYDDPSGLNDEELIKTLKNAGFSDEELIQIIKNAGLRGKPKDTNRDVEEGNAANIHALVGSGRGGDTKKPGTDSAEHIKVRTPGTNYKDSRHRGQDWPATKHGANPGFVGG